METKWRKFICAILAITVAFLFSRILRFQTGYGKLLYIRHDHMLAYFLILASFFAVFVLKGDSKEDHWDIFKDAFVDNVLMAIFLTFVLYLLHAGNAFSRIFFVSFFGFDFFLMWIFGELFRKLSKKYTKSHAKQMIVFANEFNVMQVLNRLINSGRNDFEINGIVILFEDGLEFYRVLRRENGHSYLDKNVQTLEDFLKKDVVDIAFLSLPETEDSNIADLIERLESMGINSYLTINTFDFGLEEAGIAKVGDYHVLEYSPRIFSEKELFFKRALDILGGLVGCLLCLILCLFVGPAIWLEDHGPILFQQDRVGRNGRIFKIYKFRSMYQDSEERKKELMAQNEMDGLMFKITDDPRITKVGKFIRKTSIDEFPQFFNVLKGDMSLVGTRPPTIDEFNQYSAHHKRRLSLKPGITGLWQVSGRSDITDFEEVVRLDVDYIDHWSFGNDIRIILKTVKQIFKPKGSK